MTHFPLKLTKCCDWQLLGRQVSIAWQTGIYIAWWKGTYCLADRYLLLGRHVSIAWQQVQVSIAWQQVHVSIAWWTGIYSWQTGIYYLADRHLLFGKCTYMI